MSLSTIEKHSTAVIYTESENKMGAKTMKTEHSIGLISLVFDYMVNFYPVVLINISDMISLNDDYILQV